ncbi:Elongation factor G [invertebrate metagenome]|uniref:Elongation factor G n=1 Tax=invertebrate metagenome TaxID=1711999 RepID=A0A2H9TCA2_9ZZZZ
MTKALPYSLRNIALMGQTGSGKTTLTQYLLHYNRRIHSKNLSDARNVVADNFDKTKHPKPSLETIFQQFPHLDACINLLDTPGYPDLFGRAMSVLPAVESVALVINPQMGIEASTRKAFQQIREQNKCCLIIINQCDTPKIKIAELITEITEEIGEQCLPINMLSDDASSVIDCYFSPETNELLSYKTVDYWHEKIIERVVETNDKLLQRYLEQDDNFGPQQLHDAFEKALRTRHIIPICFTSAETGLGIDLLLDIFYSIMPKPHEGTLPVLTNDHEALSLILQPESDTALPVLGQIFKVSIDPFIGQLSAVRLYQGRIETGQQLMVNDDHTPFRISHLYTIQGDKVSEISEAGPGDICAIPKESRLQYGCLIHDNLETFSQYHPSSLHFPPPMVSLAIAPQRHNDESKLSTILHRLAAEDPSLVIEHRERQNETVLHGLGSLHLNTILDKMANTYHLVVDTHIPSIPYRETITQNSTGHCRHKKQNGGSGQFGEVWLRIEPMPRGRGFEFASEVVGGTIPSQFIPAVEKGVREVMEQGAIAGYPLQDIRVIVYDGKHHSVDSKEIAFLTAGKKALLDAISQGMPVILEPYMDVIIRIPQWSMGDITGHLVSLRAIVTDTRSDDNNVLAIHASAPLASMAEYSNQLKAMTSGEGTYEMAFSHYEKVPSVIQKQLVSHFNEQTS